MSEMTYRTILEQFKDREEEVDFWHCQCCDWEVITEDQIRINDARWDKIDAKSND